MERQLNILDYALSSLWRHRFKNGSVLVVFAAVIFLLASFQMIASSLTGIAARVLQDSPEITVQRLQAGRQISLPLEYINKIEQINGISAIAPRVWGYYFDATSGANITVIGITPQLTAATKQLGRIIDKGAPQLENPESVIVGRALDATLNLAGRQIFSLYRPDLTLKSFRIAGVFAEETDTMTFDQLVMGIDDARDLFAIPADSATDLLVSVTNPTEIDTIAKKIAKVLPDARVISRPQLLKTYQVVFSWRSGFASVCLLAALAAFAIFAWDKASGLAPEEKREIGILKILGWQTADILTLRFWEGLLISLLAFVIGCTAAYIHVIFFDASLFRPILMGWSVITPPLRLVPLFAATEFLVILCFTVVPYLAATIIPAWRCAVVPADSVLH